MSLGFGPDGPAEITAEIDHESQPYIGDAYWTADQNLTFALRLPPGHFKSQICSRNYVDRSRQRGNLETCCTDLLPFLESAC